MNSPRISLGRDVGRAAAAPGIQNLSSGNIVAGEGSIFEWFGGGQQAAGVNVTPETAMRLSAVWRCVTLIAGAMMCMPLAVYRHTADGGKERVFDHPFTRFLRDETNDRTSAPEFIELQAIAMLLRGNGYALLRQARNGVLHDIDYYHPARVNAYWSSGDLWYRFTNLDGSTEVQDASRVLHFRGPGQLWDGIRAPSPITYHAQSIGIGLATRDYTAGQFERGLMTNDWFGFPEGQAVTKEQRAAFKEYLRRRGQGVANAHNPLIIENGGEWKRVGITAKDAQLLELLQYSSIDVARIFGVPPHMIGETDKTSSWGTGIEQMSLGFIRYTIMPHAVRFAKELSRKLFPTIGAKVSPLFVDFDEEYLMRGDSKAMADYFRAALGGNQLPGWMSQNEVRRKTNAPPIDGGDEVYAPAPTPAAAPPSPANPEPSNAP